MDVEIRNAGRNKGERVKTLVIITLKKQHKYNVVTFE